MSVILKERCRFFSCKVESFDLRPFLMISLQNQDFFFFNNSQFIVTKYSILLDFVSP